jgi:hypothetical protein
MPTIPQTWVGVDLDGVLAKHYWGDGVEQDDLIIGEPIPAMVGKVRDLMQEGWEVRIFTSRGAWASTLERLAIHEAIDAWCIQVFGQTFKITASKDPEMHAMLDDLAIRIVRNEGVPCCDHHERSPQ